mgnify:CR=1 FL=1
MLVRSQAVEEVINALHTAEMEAAKSRRVAMMASGAADRELEDVLDEEDDLERQARRQRHIAKKKKRGKIATACAMLCLLCWMFVLLLAVLIGTGYDSYHVNEVDYWYPVHMCRRGNGGNKPTFSSYNASLQVRALPGLGVRVGRMSPSPCRLWASSITIGRNAPLRRSRLTLPSARRLMVRGVMERIVISMAATISRQLRQSAAHAARVSSCPY